MKAPTLSLALAVLALVFAQVAYGQYKGAREYFPKSYPAPPPRGSATPGPTNGAAKASPAKPAQTRFKDLPVNTGFYFLSDTNHTYLWTKTSTSQAKNSKNGVVQSINSETPVQK